MLVSAAAFGGEGQELVSKPAPEWNLEQWQESSPLQLKALRWKVALIRWTAPDLPLLRRDNQNLRHRVIGDLDDVIHLVQANQVDISEPKWRRQLFEKYGNVNLYEKVRRATKR